VIKRSIVLEKGELEKCDGYWSEGKECRFSLLIASDIGMYTVVKVWYDGGILRRE
jgi:hypothetical protein